MTARSRQTWAALTDIGRVRTHNEDAVLAQPPLFVVADGLGGHEAGEVASSISVETLRDNAPRHPDARALARAVKAANREVMRAAKEGIGRTGMGTTLTAVIVEGCRIAVAHVGDSRAYLLHDSQLQRITDDHSLVADMIRLGQLTEAESRVHPNRSVITRALGSDTNMEADAFEVDASPGDRLMLCSDGLTSMLEDEQIAEILSAYKDPNVTAKALIAAANDAGGQDNISVIVVDIEDDAAPVSGGRFRSGRAWLFALAWLVAFALVVAGVGYGVYRYAQEQYFLVAEGGEVVIYRGVPGELGGLSLNWLVRRTGTSVDSLPVSTQTRLASGVVVGSLEEASRIADKYKEVSAPSLESSTPPSEQAP